MRFVTVKCLFSFATSSSFIYLSPSFNHLSAHSDVGTIDPTSLSPLSIGELAPGGTSYLKYDDRTHVCRVGLELTPTTPGVIYALQISPHHSYAVPTEIVIIQVRGWPGWGYWDGSNNWTIINSLPMTIASPNITTNFIYYFNSSQLLEVEPNDLLGYCFGSRPFFLLDSAAEDAYEFMWTPTSVAIGTVPTYIWFGDYPMNLQFLQWNVSRTALNMTLFNSFYSPRAPPIIAPRIGLDAFNLHSTLLGDTLIWFDTKSTTSDRCFVPNVPVTDPTLVYGFKGSYLLNNYDPYILKLIQVRMINPPTIVPSHSSATVVKLIQSIDLNINTTYLDVNPFYENNDYTNFYYPLPPDQFFSVVSGDLIGFCIDDTIYYGRSYFLYHSPDPSEGHSVFSFDLDNSHQVTLTSDVYNFNAVGWPNITRTQLNDAELTLFWEREQQMNAFTRASNHSSSGPFTPETAPILSPATTLNPSILPETTIGSLVVSNLYDLKVRTCTVMKPIIGSGIVYGLRSNLVPALANDITIRIMYGYKNYDSVFTITNHIDIVIPASTQVTKFEYYFTWEQLFETESGSDRVVGWCTPSDQPDVFAYVADSINPIYQWSTVSYLSHIIATYTDHRRYDFQLLQWADMGFNQLNKSATRAWLDLKGSSSNQLRPNTYTPPPWPNSINPFIDFSRDYRYGYLSPSSGTSWSPYSTPLCYLLDYSDASGGGPLKSSVLYGIESVRLLSSTEAANITFIVAQDESYYHDQPSWKIHTAIDIPIPPSNSSTEFAYYFTVDELIEVTAGIDFIGICDHSTTGLLSWNYNLTISSTIYGWPSDQSSGNSTYANRILDFAVAGWSGVTIHQLNLTAVNDGLMQARQEFGNVRGVKPPTSPDDSNTGDSGGGGGGGLSSGGRIALIVSMVIFGLGALVIFMMVRHRRRHPSASSAPISQPSNQDVPAVVNAANRIQPKLSARSIDGQSPPNPHQPPLIIGNSQQEGRIQPKPFIGSSLPPIRVHTAASLRTWNPMQKPQPQKPIIANGHNPGVKIRLPTSKGPPNPYIYPSSPTLPSVSPTSSSSIELHQLNRPLAVFLSPMNDIPTQPPPQYDSSIGGGKDEGGSGCEGVNIQLERPQSLVPSECRPHESLSSIQPFMLSPPTISPYASSSPMIYLAPGQPASSIGTAQAPTSSLDLVIQTPIPGGVTPPSMAIREVHFCHQCGQPKTVIRAVFCPDCGNKY